MSFSKKITERRLSAILVAFTLFATYLLYSVYSLSVTKYDYYREKTYDQVTTTSVLRAERGSIYDSNLNLLAKSSTVWRVFVSPRDIKSASKKSGVDYAKVISEGLSPILSLNEGTVYKRITESNVLDVTLKKAATDNEYGKTLEFISNAGLWDLVSLEAETKRSYPEGTLAAHVLGFTGSDNQGLYGLEYYYDKLLSGKDGYYVYAKDAGGKALDTEYSDYFPAEDGLSIITTLDSYIQSELEAVIETIRQNHEVNNRVCGIVMDTKTGAILAMATSSPFDPNDPFTLDEVSKEKLDASGLINGTDEYKAYKNQLLEIMWSNKAISETYEPGSTFKIVTVSAALDMGVASPSDTFSCKGYCEVGGWRIKCHKVSGHGSGFNLAYGLQMSCNPCMISLSERVGSNAFYSYVKSFGYFEKSGIDLPSEASTIFHKEEGLGKTELATASFGQRFKVTVINHLRAISAVANGGKLVTPYVVDRVIDADGNIVSQHDNGATRVVIDEEVANTVSQILIDGVSGDGGAKNAAVSGYDVAAKTGTSQKFDILDDNGNSYLRIGSTVAYAKNGDGGISTIIVVDEPTTSVKYGSVVAAPYISILYEKILPYLEYRSSLETVETAVDNYVGMTVDNAKKLLQKDNIAYEIIGDGKTVLTQIPTANEVFTYPISRVILYTVNVREEYVITPNLLGMSISDAIITATNAGLNIRFSGASGLSPDKDDVISEQSLTPGDKVKRGTIIKLRTINSSHED